MVPQGSDDPKKLSTGALQLLFVPSRGQMQASGLTLLHFWTELLQYCWDLLGRVEQPTFIALGSSTSSTRGLLRPRGRLHVLPGAERRLLLLMSYVVEGSSGWAPGGVGYTNGRLFEAFFAGRKTLHSAESTLIRCYPKAAFL